MVFGEGAQAAQVLGADLAGTFQRTAPAYPVDGTSLKPSCSATLVSPLMRRWL